MILTTAIVRAHANGSRPVTALVQYFEGRRGYPGPADHATGCGVRHRRQRQHGQGATSVLRRRAPSPRDTR
jgi:hypothetical protein